WRHSLVRCRTLILAGQVVPVLLPPGLVIAAVLQFQFGAAHLAPVEVPGDFATLLLCEFPRGIPAQSAVGQAVAVGIKVSRDTLSGQQPGRGVHGTLPLAPGTSLAMRPHAGGFNAVQTAA